MHQKAEGKTMIARDAKDAAEGAVILRPPNEQTHHRAILAELPPDPKPTRQEINSLINCDKFPRSPDKIVRTLARLSWMVKTKEANPDLFLVPFSSDIHSFPDASESYRSYLAGELWHAIRIKVLDRSGGRCECCGEGATQVHHRDYRPRVIRGEDLLPLVSICRHCHKFIHNDPETGKARSSWQDEEAALAEIYQHGILNIAPSS